jgi:hypothetical protein
LTRHKKSIPNSKIKGTGSVAIETVAWSHPFHKSYPSKIEKKQDELLPGKKKIMDNLCPVNSRSVALLVLAIAILLSLLHRSFLESRVTNSALSPIISATKDVMEGTERIGVIRYHYFDKFLEGMDDDVGTNDGSTSKQCSDILIVGVGTAMKVDDYDKLAASIVSTTGSSSLVVIISDSNPGLLEIVKFDPTKYARLLNGIRDQLDNDLIAGCTGKSYQNFLIGGHSASGQAALGAAQKGLYNFTPDGFVGLDPFEISEAKMDFTSPLKFPTLSWGFMRTTCFVQVKKAARGAYRLTSSDSGRVLYLIDNDKQSGITHCVFTDGGCVPPVAFVCPTLKNPEWLYSQLGESINSFVNVLKTEGRLFTREAFEVPSTGPRGNVTLFLNSDIVDDNVDDNSNFCGNDGDGSSESADKAIGNNMDTDDSQE